MLLSIVTTLYNSQDYITNFHKRIVAQIKPITNNYEIIFVNDGSSDQSLQHAIDLIETDPHVKVIDLTRNFGHHKAIMHGLLQAKGEFIFLIDVDLEELPEWLEIFWQRIHENDHPDVVYAINTAKSDSSSENLFRNMFYKLFNFMSDVNVPSNVLTARLFRRHVIDKLTHYQTQQVYIAAIIASIGGHQVGIPVKKPDYNKTTYSLVKKLQLFLTAITSFSAKPLHLLFYFGFAILCISAVTIIAFLLQQIYLGLPIAGWTSLILSIWFLGGFTISSIGICGLYIGRIFNEVKKQPHILVKKVYNSDGM